MRLQLEFIHYRRLPVIEIGFLLVASLFLGEALLQWRVAYLDEQQARGKLVALEQAIKDRERATLLQKNLADPGAIQRAKEEKKVIDALRYPWNRVLASIEQADSADVALLSLTHDQSIAATQLQVEALDAGALFGYVDKLNVGAEDGGDIWYLSKFEVLSRNSPPVVKGTVLLMQRPSKPL